MSDDENPRTAARRKLDDAVIEYATAMRAGDDVLGVGAWIVAIHGPHAEDGRDTYLVESAPNQPWHASVGLIRYATLHYEGMEDE